MFTIQSWLGSISLRILPDENTSRINKPLSSRELSRYLPPCYCLRPLRPHHTYPAYLVPAHSCVFHEAQQYPRRLSVARPMGGALRPQRLRPAASDGVHDDGETPPCPQLRILALPCAPSRDFYGQCDTAVRDVAGVAYRKRSDAMPTMRATMGRRARGR
jgi:hypothetical protein